MIQLIPQVTSPFRVDSPVLILSAFRQVWMNFRRRSTSGEFITGRSIHPIPSSPSISTAEQREDSISLQRRTEPLSTSTGIAPILFIGWMISGLTLGPYAIVQDLAIPIQVQPYCYGTLCAIILSQWLFYDCGYSLSRSVGVFGLYVVLGGGVDVGIYFACKVIPLSLTPRLHLTDPDARTHL